MALRRVEGGERALDAIEDDDDVKKTYEFVRKVAVNGGELPSGRGKW